MRWRRRKFRPGQIVEMCSYHPVLLTEVDYAYDELVGIDLYHGGDTSCSIHHCGAYVMTPGQVAARIALRDRLLEAERILHETGDRTAWDALGLD